MVIESKQKLQSFVVPNPHSIFLLLTLYFLRKVSMNYTLKVPREARVVCGEAPRDAPVSVPGEPVSDGSRLLSFAALVCVADVPCHCFETLFSNVFNLFALSA